MARLGRRIRTLRKQAELTQEKTAEQAALDDKHLQALEAGDGNPTLASLIGIARALDVKLKDLFEGV